MCASTVTVLGTTSLTMLKRHKPFLGQVPLTTVPLGMKFRLKRRFTIEYNIVVMLVVVLVVAVTVLVVVVVVVLTQMALTFLFGP